MEKTKSDNEAACCECSCCKPCCSLIARICQALSKICGSCCKGCGCQKTE